MKTPFTTMLAELSIMLGNKRITPTSSSDIDALDDKDDDQDGGMELPSDDSSPFGKTPDGEDADCSMDSESGPVPSDDEIADLDDKDQDLSKLTLDQIIAALMAMKAGQEGEKDIGGERIEPHNDFADVDPDAPNENINPADNRMPDEGQIDDEGIPSLPGMRRSPEDEQLAGAKTSKNPFSNDEDDEDDELDMDPAADPKGASFDSFDADPEDGNQAPGGDDDQMSDGDDLSDPDAMGGDTEDDQPDENHMGTIRAVKGAHLVYKRQAGDGTFSELWTYNIGEHINDSISVKKAIVAGTDIPEDKLRSEDGTQSYELVTMGNAQMLKISGLPN